MPPLKDLTGLNFGRLRVLYISERKSGSRPMWICRCECGKLKDIAGCHLRSGVVVSCGCHRDEFREKHNNRQREINQPKKILKMIGKATLADIATAAGVSVATVQYWHEKMGISTPTAKRRRLMRDISEILSTNP